MKVNASLFPHWLSDCFSGLSHFFERIKKAVLRAFGCLDEQPLKKEPINASKKDKIPSVDKVRDKHFPSSNPTIQPPLQKQPPNATKHPSDTMSDADLAKYAESTKDTKKDLVLHEHEPIVEKPISVVEYAKVIYRENLDPRYDTPKARAEFAPKKARNQNYQKRLIAISNRFHTPHVYPVRGDGNCFCNAAVAGLVASIVKNPRIKSSILEKIKNAEAAEFPYITPDTSPNALEYGKKFSKADDFKTVLERLEGQASSEWLNDFDFTSKFSRVIRSMLLIEDNNQDAQLRSFGNEMEATFIYGLYRIFDLNIKLAILENNNQLVDPKDPNEYGVTDPLEEIQNTKKDKADFVIVLKSAHYFALINLID